MAFRSELSDKIPSRTLAVLFICLLLTTTLSISVLSVGAGAQHDDLYENDARAESPLTSATGSVEVVVRLKEATIPNEASEADAEQLLEDHAEDTQEPLLEYAAETPGISVETEFWVTNAVLLEVDTDRVDLETIAAFTAVEAVHENFELTVPEPPTINTLYHSEWISPTGSTTETRHPTPGIERLNAPDVWDTYGTRGGGVRVAVLDTGIDADHPDLDLYTADPSDPTYPGGWAAFDETGNRIGGSTPYDSGIHGTHVSGTVAGGEASGLQVGVAPDVELLHGLVLNGTSGSFAQLIAGMEWALEEDADVINLSLGMAGRHSQLIDPVRNAIDSGAVVVGAIGNEGVGTSGSPGNVYETVSVGAVNEHGAVASFSGGERINRSEWQTAPESWPPSYVAPDVVAYGVEVVSPVPDGHYQALHGTSMATPHVSGAVALMLSAEPDATPDTVSTALYETAWSPNETVTANTTMDVRYGYGIVDAKAATDALVAAHSETATTTTGETVETDTTPTRATPPFSRVVAGTISILVAAISVVALLSARALARETSR